MALICLFLSIFFLSLYNMLVFKICVGVFSETVKARMLKLGIHMDNELLYCGIENCTPCFYSSLYFFIFCLLRQNFSLSFLRNCASQNLQIWYTNVS